MTSESNVEFLARTAGVEEGVTAGPWRDRPLLIGIGVYGQGEYEVIADLRSEGNLKNAAWIAAARTDYPEALRRLATVVAEIAKLERGINRCDTPDCGTSDLRRRHA